MMDQLKDFRGTPIAPGACIVYAVKASTYPYIREAIVEAVETRRAGWGNLEDQLVLKVRPTGRGSNSYHSRVSSESVTLSCLDRLVVVRESTR